MPYSGGSDPSLPSNVKKLPAKKRRQWVEVFNSVIGRGGDESSAFRQANGVVKESSVDLEEVAREAGAETEYKALMEKCGPMEIQVWRPLGGATFIRRRFFGEAEKTKEIDPLASYLAGLIDPNTPDFGSFTVTKDAQGMPRWLAVYSNKYYDRDKEVLPEQEHRDFIAWVDRTKAYPELWLWHTPGSRIGQADWVDYSTTGFALAAGSFDPGMGDVADALARDRDLGVSHGFKFRQLDPDGAYHGYRSFEISPLPARKAANPGTAFSAAIKEATMLSAEKRTWLVGLMGEERVKQVETVLGVMAKEMADKGVVFKDFMADYVSGSPAADAAKSVPPNDSPTATPSGNLLSLDAIKAALGETVKEQVQSALAPVGARLEALEKAANPASGDFTPRATPVAAAVSVETAPSSTSIQQGDPLYAMAKEAEKQLAEAQAITEEAAKLPGAVAWHIAALGAAGVASANGVGAGA